tara:strand:- start:806 stop:1096 length:291 start_codon:yes stop_codon:yes gene_type:complete
MMSDRAEKFIFSQWLNSRFASQHVALDFEVAAKCGGIVTPCLSAHAIFSSSVLQQQVSQHCPALEQPQAELSQGNRSHCRDTSCAIGSGTPTTTIA